MPASTLADEKLGVENGGTGCVPERLLAINGVVDRADGTTVHDGPRPINLAGACEPVQQRKVHQIPHARPLPIA